MGVGEHILRIDGVNHVRRGIAIMGIQFVIHLDEVGADSLRLDEFAGDLRRDLIDADVDSVNSLTEGSAPAAAKGLDLVAIGALVVTVSRSATFERVLSIARSWLARRPSVRSVKVSVGDRTIELTAASAQQQDLLVAEFVRLLSKD